ncbi:uncharacterized protein BX663DRAFT_505998 [Cokeromyces recurvatus]|uniref:uncharacterized protein n=1 Tax=Cokeromyces recurvatus TaxID=90255 RepID=UPI002220FE35|nr:uncharacterized protein BX663DRAFT_505998 [Cokeromyces recurvatus]KAI7903987.1 hypothetical protein BX663DRAFT_505998 [Cokeromyces recurvatus]
MNFQSIDYLQQTTQQMQTGILSKSIHSTKRKLEEDTNEESINLKRPHLMNHSLSLLQKEDSKDFRKQQYMTSISDYKSNTIVDNNATLSLTTTTTATAFDAITPPADDIMMIEDDYTDEDELLQTPSYMNSYFNYIPVDTEDDLENGGFTGQLELGWSEMYYDMISEM